MHFLVVLDEFHQMNSWMVFHHYLSAKMAQTLKISYGEMYWFLLFDCFCRRDSGVYNVLEMKWVV